MAKDQTASTDVPASSAPGAAVEAAPTVFPLHLDEFCARLSATDKRVELIGGFHHTERVAGRTQDLESAYADRFAEFVSRPV